MAALLLRWSQHEAPKPYARPFMVSFLDDSGEILGSIAASGPDLLFYRHFQLAVAHLGGELFRDHDVETAPDPQRTWLDRLAELLPATPAFTVVPISTFDHERGRGFSYAVRWDGAPPLQLSATQLLDYQEFQAAVAHQSGTLYRNAGVESHEDAAARQVAWTALLSDVVARPDEADAMAAAWPWR